MDPSQTVVVAATLDNLDFLQSNAAVYCGDQHRSWHGTTVQILQPKPPSQANNMSVSMATTLSLPPSKKKERRSRTAKERSEGEDNAISLLPLVEQTVDCQTISLVIEGKTMKDFLVSDNEKGRLNEFTQKAFDYITDRVQTTTTVGMQEYLRQAQGVSVREKTMYKYFDILDTNSESKETLLNSLAKLHKELKVGNKLQHLIVVVDAKIFPILQSIKQEDQATFEWLIPFPGDFHLLMNYQKVIMKIYWDAGLKQIAEASGFRGETLTSLEHCSNFTNTSRFLFQVWEAIFKHMQTMWLQRTCQPKPDPKHAPSKELLDSFIAFLELKSVEDDNWRFWGDFVFKTQ